MKTTVAQQIRTLGGKGHEETGIPYASERSGYNLDSIASASNQVYQAEVINRVQQEAKNQADIREAELKGITVEQLTNEKANTSNVANGSMTETAQEVSHGMKKWYGLNCVVYSKKSRMPVCHNLEQTANWKCKSHSNSVTLFSKENYFVESIRKKKEKNK